MELISDGAIAVIDTERAAVTALRDLFDGDYLREGGLSVCFPFEDREKSAHFLTEQATARTLGQRKESLHLAFSSNADTKTVFTPSFQLLVLYTVEGAGLHVECTLHNIGAEEPLPFYLGLDAHLRHPLFDWEDAADYSLDAGPGTPQAASALLASRKTGRGIEFGWEEFSFRRPEDLTRGDDGAHLTFDAQAQPGALSGRAPIAPMGSWRAGLRIAFL